MTGILAIMLLAGLLRFAWLDRIPPPINQDEANRAYEAWCLLHTGYDHLGVRWPIFFRAFGNADYPPGTYIYALLPVQALFGMTVWSTRLPAALLGTLNVWLVYLLVRRLYGDRTAWWAALLLAVSPWHVHLSRLAFEVSLCPPLITLGFYCIVRSAAARDAVRSPALVGLGLAGLAFGTALWSYNALRVVVPLLLAGGGLLYAARIRTFLGRPRGGWGGVLFLGGLGAGLAPLVWASISTPGQAWARAATVNVFNTSSNWAEALATFCRGYFMHLGPTFLFREGDESLIQSVPHYGQLHFFCAVLLPVGLYRVLRRWPAERFGLLVLYWILIAPLPAAGTPVTVGHALRSAGVLPAYQILAALGADLLLGAARRRSAALYRTAARTLGAVVAAGTAYFLYIFLFTYPGASAEAMQAEWGPVITEVRRREADYDLILLTHQATNQLGLLYLFWARVDPAEYFNAPRHIEVGTYWDRIVQVGKVVFLGAAYLDQVAARVPPHARILLAERPGIPVPGLELRRFVLPDGRIAVVLYELSADTIPTLASQPTSPP